MEPALTWDEPRPVRLTVDDLILLDRVGAFETRGRTELIEGTLVETSPQGRPHSFAKNELTHRLRVALERLGSPWVAQSEATIAWPPYSAPEPDIIVTDAPRGEGYVPVGSVALAIEIADTSLKYDLTVKKAVYAGAGIPEYWVVDVRHRRVHQFWSPGTSGYGEERIVPSDSLLASATMAELAVDGGGIL